MAQRKNEYADVFNRVEHGDEQALHRLRYLMALGFEEAVLLETAVRSALCAGICRSPYCRMAASESAGSDNYRLPKAAKGRMGKRHFAGGNAGLALLHPLERFIPTHRLSPSNSVLNMGRCCRVRCLRVIAVRQCGGSGLPVPGMRQRMAVKAAIIRVKLLLSNLPAMQCLRIIRAEQ